MLKEFKEFAMQASVNPARSTGPALIVGKWALAQLWLSWVAPMIGAPLYPFMQT